MHAHESGAIPTLTIPAQSYSFKFGLEELSVSVLSNCNNKASKY